MFLLKCYNNTGFGNGNYLNDEIYLKAIKREDIVGIDNQIEELKHIRPKHILLTGITGYIAQRLLPILVKQGHHVTCCTRDMGRVDSESIVSSHVTIIEVDLLKKEHLKRIPKSIDAAFYLVHSMASGFDDFEELELKCAEHFKEAMENRNVEQVIYLSGIVNTKKLSKHLQSRLNVENALRSHRYALTTLRAGIIVGSGSASFEIIRDLVEKLPIMVTPRWLNTRSQPISVRNVMHCLIGVLLQPFTYNHSYDIGGPDILSYKEMLLRFGKVRGLKRYILVLPILTVRLSSYWLYFVTATSYSLARNLVESMKNEVICRPNNLMEKLGIELLNYETAIQAAFDKIEQNQVISSWKDATSSPVLKKGIHHYIKIPKHGCFVDQRVRPVKQMDQTLKKIWAVGGNTGWYHANFLWEIRGFLDQLFGGVGMRRGRRSDSDIKPGDTIDFWRVILADRKHKRLLLYAEMKLPGEAWLEFKINARNDLIQTATFRPVGVLGRLYWYCVLPFHEIIFNGMINTIVAEN